jgi:hypothetical protein
MSDWPPNDSDDGHVISGRVREEQASASSQQGTSSSDNLGQVSVREEDEILYVEDLGSSQLVKSISPAACDVYIVWIDGKTGGFTDTRAIVVQH